MFYRRRSNLHECTRMAMLAGMLALTACSSSISSGPHYMVYFPLRSARLDARAQDLIALAAARANARPAARITVTGYTDSAGSPPADVLLSRQRAQAVADVLTANGVATSRIVRVDAGQTNEDPGLASRRVDITIGG